MRRRRRSGFAAEIQDFAQSFQAGWNMVDRIKNPPRERGRAISDTERRRRDEEEGVKRYQDDAEREAAGRSGGARSTSVRGGGADTPAKASQVSNEFISEVRERGLTNPFALAAIGATGQRESGWSPERLNANWSDPSESGVAGRSGGSLSWRDGRLSALEQFAKREGSDSRYGDARTQARFFMQEDPRLIERLQNARSTDEAMQAMNNAWRFAGYNRESPERSARFSAARSWLPKVGGDGYSESNPDEEGSREVAVPEQTALDTTDDAAYAEEATIDDGYSDDGYSDADYSDADYSDAGAVDDWGDWGEEATVFASTGGAISGPASVAQRPMPRFAPRVRPRPAATAIANPAAPVAAPRVRAGDRMRQLRDQRVARQREAEAEAARRKAAVDYSFFKGDDDSMFANRIWAANVREAAAREAGRSSGGGLMDIQFANEHLGGLRLDPTGTYVVRPPNQNSSQAERDNYMKLPKVDSARDITVPREWSMNFAEGGYVDEDMRRDERDYEEPYYPEDVPRRALSLDEEGADPDTVPANPRAVPDARGGYRQEGGDGGEPDRPVPRGEPRSRGGYRQEGGDEGEPDRAAPRTALAPLENKGNVVPRPVARRRGEEPRREAPREGAQRSETRQPVERLNRTGDESPTEFWINEARANGPGDAVRAGMSFIQQMFGFGQGAITPDARDPQRAQAIRAFATNAEAPTQDEVRQIDKAIDPEGKLPPHLRSLARLYGTYKYYEERGDSRKAASIAGAMLLNAKRNAQFYGSVVQDRIQRGDMQGAAGAAERAYGEYPDGKRVEVKPAGREFTFRVIDDEGKLTQEGRLSINEMMRMATGLQDGTEWFRSLGYLMDPKPARSGSQRAPAPERLSADERRERDARTERETMDRQRMDRIGAAERQQLSALDASAENSPTEQMDLRRGTMANAEAARNNERELTAADNAYRRAVPRTNVPRADNEEIMTGASDVLGTPATGNAEPDPVGKLPPEMRAAARTVIGRAAARAVMANPGLSSADAGRIIAGIVMNGREMRSDGTVAPKGDKASPGVFLDRQSLMDIHRFVAARASSAQSPAAPAASMPSAPARPQAQTSVRQRQVPPDISAAAAAALGRGGATANTGQELQESVGNVYGLR